MEWYAVAKVEEWIEMFDKTYLDGCSWDWKENRKWCVRWINSYFKLRLKCGP